MVVVRLDDSLKTKLSGGCTTCSGKPHGWIAHTRTCTILASVSPTSDVGNEDTSELLRICIDLRLKAENYILASLPTLLNLRGHSGSYT